MYSGEAVGERTSLARLEALADLAAIGWDRPEREIVRAGADVAQRSTGSSIAYIHFLNDDQETIELGAWSSDTLAHCTTVYDRHYPISRAGIWADSARGRKSVVHNDYPETGARRGLPSGHVPLRRHLGVPIEHGGLVRLLIGVGNKVAPYDDDDVATLEIVGRGLWELVRARREMERLQDFESRFRHLQRVAAATAFEYDRDDDRLSFDELFASVFGSQHPTEIPGSLHQLVAFVDAPDRERVRGVLEGGADGAQFDERVGLVRTSGQRFSASLRGSIRRRDLGHGLVAVGVLQDLTEHARLESLQHEAETDTLTGLPNRRRLQAWFEGRRQERRHEGDAWAFHYIDLDEFKPINDSHGHGAGDEVLRIVSRRLHALVRRDDLVVRLGGDEFAIVQTGVGDAEGARALAAKAVAECRAPMLVNGIELRVGASVGVAVSSGATCTLAEVAARADRALYDAKRAGRGQVVMADTERLPAR